MSGTRESALAAVDTFKEKYGEDYFSRIGKLGDSVRVSKGFGKNKRTFLDKILHREK